MSFHQYPCHFEPFSSSKLVQIHKHVSVATNKHNQSIIPHQNVYIPSSSKAVATATALSFVVGFLLVVEICLHSLSPKAEACSTFKLCGSVMSHSDTLSPSTSSTGFLSFMGLGLICALKNPEIKSRDRERDRERDRIRNVDVLPCSDPKEEPV